MRACLIDKKSDKNGIGACKRVNMILGNKGAVCAIVQF